jgi:hypothetical protein
METILGFEKNNMKDEYIGHYTSGHRFLFIIA